MIIQGKASLYPHSGIKDQPGPLSLRIGTQFQPPYVRGWTGKRALIAFDQPQEGTNFTMLYVLFLKSKQTKPDIARGLTFHYARTYQKTNGTLEVRIKNRYRGSSPMPFPLCLYQGSCRFTDTMALYSLQAGPTQTTAPVEEPKLILTPNDKEYHGTLRQAARALQTKDGMDEGANEAGRFRIV